MNLPHDRNTTLSCGFEFLPLDRTNISPDVYAALVVKITIDIFICPFTILLNILVMIAVKTKRQLRTTSNIALACLAATDFNVGLVLQPLQIATFSLMLQGGETPNVLCTLIDVTRTVSVTCSLASLYHLFVISGERYLAIKHSFAYETGLVTEARIIMASGLAWVGTAVILSIQHIFKAKSQFQFMSKLSLMVTLFIIIPVITMVYFHVAVYKEVRRNKEQIIANQVSLEERAKLLRNKKSFYTTTIVLLTIILCYIPTNIWAVILAALKNGIPANVKHIVFNVTTSLLVLNSLFNPLIYAVRIRYFRVAFIQLLSRKTLAQAEELEKRVFGSRRIGVVGTAEQEQNRASGDDEAY
jgi:hypothetical protein